MKISNFLYSFVSVIFLCLISSIARSEDTLDDLSQSMESIAKEFDKLSSSELEESILIDDAIEEINTAIEFVEQSIKNEDPESAIIVLEFMDRTLSDVSSIVPEEVYSDMSEMNIDSFSQEDMQEIQQITQAMNSKKEDTLDTMIEGMVELNKKGFNTFAISRKRSWRLNWRNTAKIPMAISSSRKSNCFRHSATSYLSGLKMDESIPVGIDCIL